ncbi:hypothetical protein [Runella zeae]|uniref:hypothetical protein n=1 Tax=Runella zeae TaxID=94255 RepID=UPI00041ADEC2|nr:hypothetical protein [Runella zeae]
MKYKGSQISSLLVSIENFFILKLTGQVQFRPNDVLTISKKTALTIFIFLFTISLRAQESKDSTKWEIGTDLLWLIDKNSLPKYSMFAKRTLKKNGALRLRVGTDIKTDPRNIGLGIEKASYIIRIGYEKQKKLSDKASVFWGIDAHFRKENVEAYVIPLPQGKPFYYPDYSWQLGGAAILGFRYFINKNFSFSTEASLNSYYREFSSNNYSGGFLIVINDNYTRSPDFAFISKTYIKSLVVEIAPLQVLNFSYHF